MEPAKTISQTTGLPFPHSGSSLKTERSRGEMSSGEAGRGVGSRPSSGPIDVRRASVIEGVERKGVQGEI